METEMKSHVVYVGKAQEKSRYLFPVKRYAVLNKTQ